MMYEMNEEIEELRDNLEDAHRRIDVLESLLMPERTSLVPESIINGTFFSAPFIALYDMFRGVR